MQATDDAVNGLRPEPAVRRSIAVIAPWVMGGGAQAALIAIIERLVPEADVTVFVLFAGSTGLSKFDENASVEDLRHRKTPLGVWRAARDLRRRLQSFDSVYSLMRGSHIVIGVSPRRVLPAGARFVATFHQLPSSDSIGIASRVEDLLVRRSTRAADLVTAPSRRGVREIIERGFAAPDRVALEPNFVRRPGTRPHPPRTGSLEPVRLLFAGRLTAQKGLDRIPDLLAGVDRSVHLRVAGSGPDEAALRKAYASIPGRHTVEFIGELDDVTPEIDWADALLMPSRAELNPMIIWEARLRGRPALCSDIDAFQDLAGDGGIWMFGDSAEFARILDSFANDERSREELFTSLPALVPDEKGGSAIAHALTH
jgi:glycosyltransferase involved in cell wall biosynthesis